MCVDEPFWPDPARPGRDGPVPHGWRRMCQVGLRYRYDLPDGIRYTPADQGELARTLRNATDRLRDTPAVRVTYTGEDETGVTAGEALVVRPSFRLRETVETSGITITEDRTLVPGTQYLRIDDGISEGGASGFTPLPVTEYEAATLLDSVFTARGRLAPDLKLIALLVEDVAGTATESPTGTFRMEFRSSDVAERLDEEGFYVDGSEAHLTAVDATAFEFEFSGGSLVRLTTEGVQFHDGEPIHDVVFSISYEPVELEVIKPPA